MLSVPRHHAFSRWIPWLYVAVFVPVVAVNLLLVRLALSSNTGLVTERAFDTGQSYNAVIAAGARQQALGWQAAVDVQPESLPHRMALSIAMTGADHQPLTGLIVAGRLVSPVDPQPDIAAALVETSGGRYRTVLTVPRAGQWELQLVASDGAGQFAILQRLTAP